MAEHHLASHQLLIAASKLLPILGALAALLLLTSTSLLEELGSQVLVILARHWQ